MIWINDISIQKKSWIFSPMNEKKYSGQSISRTSPLDGVLLSIVFKKGSTQASL